MRPRPLVVFDRLDLLEWQFCQRISRLSIYRPWRITLQAASRLGDWPVWVLLILAQPWLQQTAPGVSCSTACLRCLPWPFIGW